jgi:uncharacterized protein YbbC (DUF1343 family)
MILTGLDRLLEDPAVLRGRRYGLLSHSAARSADLWPIHVALLRSGADRPTVLFGPEHGFYGVEQDMVPSLDEVDSWTELPTLSLYGDSDESLRPNPETLMDLDLLVIDLQDVGTRYYTYAATAIWAAEMAIARGLEVWILDRPNPLGGVRVEGNLRSDDLESFVGAFRLPARHGLTLGELARLEAQRGRELAACRIWEIGGWDRRMVWQDFQRPWFAPSPNLPSEEIAFLYPGMCLVEGTELSEGRGTTRPFQLVGAPGLDAVKIADTLNGRSLAGVEFLPTFFRPQFHKHGGEVCSGVEIRVTDYGQLRPFRCGVELLQAVRQHAPEALIWRQEAYEFVADRPAIDLLAGDTVLRERLDGGEDLDSWVASWGEDESEFLRERQEILLYPEPV